MSTYKISSLEIEGFLSYGPRQVVVFPTESGVYRIDGFNHVEPRLGSNGSGKTGILNAVSWVRYDKTVNRLFGPGVKCWHSTKSSRINTEVVEYGTKNNVPYVIRRTQDPKGLFLSVDGSESRVVDQATLNVFLECDYDMFLASVLFVSDGTSFMQLGATDQSNRLAEVLKLDVWADRAAAAAKKSDELRQIATKNQNRAAELLARQEAHRKTLAEQKQLRDSHAAELEALKSSDVEKLEKLRESLPAASKRPQLVVESPAQDRLNEVRLAAAKALTSRSAAHKRLAEASAAVQEARQKKAEFEATPAEICAACGSQISANNAEYALHAQTFSDQLSQAEQREGLASQEFSQASTKLAELKEKETEAAKQAAQEIEEQAELREKYDRELSAWSAAKARRDLISKQITELENAEYPEFDSRTLDRVLKELRSEKLVIAECQEKELEATQEAAKHAFWADGFARIRMAEMERACAEFTTHMLSAFEVLGLVGWQAQVSCVHETKSKEKRAKFNIRIKSDVSPDWVDWRCWSGGQAHRLSQAGDMAFADMVSSRSGTQFLDEFWDERTNTLSQQGCNDQMEYLSMRAQARGLVIMAIDHRTGDSPVFKGLLWVDRTTTGSKVSWKHGAVS